MGKKNSKLKDDTLDQLCADTYCKYEQNISLPNFLHFACYSLNVQPNQLK